MAALETPAARLFRFQRRQNNMSDFWGRDMYLGAHVLLPQGWEFNPDVKYPLAISCIYEIT